MHPFMKKAIDLAIKNVEDGGQPFGAVLAKNDKIIAEGVNELHNTYDISGHAELIAIRKAQEILQTNDLSGFTMYASGHPCPMCYTAMYLAGIRDIYFGNGIEETAKAGLTASAKLYSDLKLDNEKREVVMKHLPLTSDMENPMTLWTDRQATNE